MATPFEHQDWKQITLRSKDGKKQDPLVSNFKPPNVVKKYNGGKNTQSSSSNASHIEKNVDNDDLSVQHVSHSLKMQIQAARKQKNWTQKQLAQACNLPESVIRSYENETAIPKGPELVKMNKALGVTLKK